MLLLCINIFKEVELEIGHLFSLFFPFGAFGSQERIKLEHDYTPTNIESKVRGFFSIYFIKPHLVRAKFDAYF